MISETTNEDCMELMARQYELINANVLDGLARICTESIDSVITSPPYWQLRDYGYSEQWGLEPTFQEYLDHLWSLMDEVWRVLKPEGTVWVNLGDTYGTQSGAMRDGNFGDKNTNNQRFIQPKVTHKCLLLIPHRFAIGCIDRGWIVRNDCIWAKRNGMPESVTDRFSKKHEYFFFMVKQPKYYFDLDSIRDAHLYGAQQHTSRKSFVNGQTSKSVLHDHPNGKNPGDVSDFWDVTTKGSSTKHYATFNTQLIDKPIKAGCPENGIILDPFCGTATTGVRAIELGRRFIGIDGSAEYIAIAEDRMSVATIQPKLFTPEVEQPKQTSFLD